MASHWFPISKCRSYNLHTLNYTGWERLILSTGFMLIHTDSVPRISSHIRIIHNLGGTPVMSVSISIYRRRERHSPLLDALKRVRYTVRSNSRVQKTYIFLPRNLRRHLRQTKHKNHVIFDMIVCLVFVTRQRFQGQVREIHDDNT